MLVRCEKRPGDLALRAHLCQQAIMAGDFGGNDMPKMKTHRGAAKRFKKTGSGKILMSHSHMNHMSSSKTQKQKRHLRHTTTMAAGDLKRIKQMITYM